MELELNTAAQAGKHAGPRPASGEAGKATMKVRVKAITREADGISSFELVDPAGRDLPAFTAGAHIDVYPGDDLMRQYSLCNDPAERHRYLIAVLREEDGRGGSVAMHDSVGEGSELTISEPRNHFSLAGREASFHLLIAGGIGVTPMMAMVATLEAEGKDYILHYCTRSPERTAFRDRLAPLIEKGRVVLHHDNGDPSKGLDLAATLGDFRPGMHCYFCGPPGFMSAAMASVGAWPPHAVHKEYFTAAERDGEWEDLPFQVKLARSGEVLDVPAERTIIEVLRAQGLDVETSCEEGYCGTCLTRYLEGEPEHRDTVLDDADKEEFVMICCARTRGGLLVLDL